MNAHFQPPGHGAAPRAANADKTWAPGARRTFPATTRTVAMLMAVVLATACPMFGIYPILAQKAGQEGLAAAALLGTTVASFFSISALLLVLRGLPGWLG